jgi:integrase
MKSRKGCEYGKKKPFTPKQVRLLKDILESKKSIRDLALCSLGFDTMLRASDILKLTVEDVIDNNSNIKSEITLKQKKTKEAHIVEIFDETKRYLLELIKKDRLYDDDYLFIGWRDRNKHLTIRQLANLVKKWASYLELNPKDYGSHSLRRTRASYIYKKTGNIEAVRLLLGQSSVSSTSYYLDIDKREALNIGREFVV